MRWDDILKEQLFKIAVECNVENIQDEPITADHPVVLKVTEVFGHQDADSRAVLYQLEKMNFFSTKQNSRRDGIFYRRNPSNTIKNLKVSVPYRSLSNDQDSILCKGATNCFRYGWTVNDVCHHYGKMFERSPNNILKVLFNSGIVIAEENEFKPAVHTRTGSDRELLSAYILSRKADPKIREAIDKYREQASELYNTGSKLLPASIFSNDGTGFGKSYGVINTYISNQPYEVTHGSGYNNLLFITPQKAQIDFPEPLINKAHKKNIEFVSILARQDLLSLEFEQWIIDTNGVKKSNKDRYRDWVSRQKKKESPLSKELSRLDQVIRTTEATNERIAYEKKNPDGNAEYIQELEDQLDRLQNSLDSALKKLTKAALNSNGKAIDLPKIMNAQSGIDALRREIISHCTPLAVAMVKPSILLATTSKFDRHIDLPIKTGSGDYSLKSLPFDCMLGGKQDLKENNTGLYASSSHKDQIAFIQDILLAKDENNPFRKNNITFTLVVDEEHEAYKVFTTSASVSLITPEIQLAHVLAGISRVLAQTTDIDEDEKLEAPFYQEKVQFINEIRDNLSKKCDISPNQTLSTILDVFSRNIDFVQIKSGDVEQVINITRNVFSFTPKRFFNEQGLKRIRIKPAYGSGACQLYYTTEVTDKWPSLHDIYQVAMSVLAAAAKIPGSSEFLKSLKQGIDSSQNYPLYKFIKKARTVMTEVGYMFERNADENLEIDHFFTYFIPKTVFSVQKVKDLEFKDKSLSKLTYVNFNLDLIKEQPEISQLRILHDTSNSIISLSATSGFADNISGQYNRSFLRKFCSEGDDNLQIDVITRTTADIETLSGLRNQRAELRSVEIFPFDERSSQLSTSQKCSTFQDVFKTWERRLKEASKKELFNQYHQQEFNRQLTTMLLAAYDQKHTLSLSLRGSFQRIVSSYLKSVKYGRSAKPKDLHILEDDGRVFEIKPFDDGGTIRVILYDAQLAREHDVREFTSIDRHNLKIVFISSYKSAGTGLNYFITYPDSLNETYEEDFERLVLINSPFYSDIIRDPKSDDRTLHSLKNYLLLMKRYSDSQEVKLLKDFDVNLVHGEDYRFLMHEHAMEILKVLMQAIGRIERKDAKMTSEIYLPDSLLDDAMLLFSKIRRNPANTVVRESMSLLNYRLMELCQKREQECGFYSDDEREVFESYIADSSEILDEFFEDFIPEVLQSAREGNIDAVRFNESLRSIDGISNPEKYIQELEANPLVQEDEYAQEAISRLFIDLSKFGRSLKLCRRQSNANILTDISHGDHLYLPSRQIVIDYSDKMTFANDKTAIKLARKSQEIASKAFLNYVPHPKFIPLLKGNMGEYLFLELLGTLGIKPLSTDQILAAIGARSYELFDVYIEIDKMLVCVDVKNWSSTFDRKEMSSETHKKAQGKALTIKSLTSDQYEEIRFIYLNTRLEYNPLNLEQESCAGNIYYLNMLKEEAGYRDKRQRIPSETGDEYCTVGSELKQQVIINKKLISLVQGV